MKTLAELLEDFLEHERSLNHSHRTLKNYRFYGQTFLRWLEENFHVRTADRIRKKHIHTWAQHLHDHRTWRGLPLKPESLNKALQGVRAFLKYLASRDYVLRSIPDAVEYVKTPKLLPQGVLTHAQVKKLLSKIPTNSVEGYRNRAMLEMLYSSAVRAAELVGLNVPDVDLQNRTAVVMGKGKKQRVVPIGRAALRHLETYLKAVRPYLVQDPRQQALFLKRDGSRLGYDGLLIMTQRYAAAARLDVRVSTHTFRRSCATELIRGGANMYHVKEMLGHESLDMLKHYAKLTITDLKRTHEKCHPRER